MLKKKVVLVAAQRSGTHPLANHLSGASIFLADEVFHPNASSDLLKDHLRYARFLDHENVLAREVFLNPSKVLTRYFKYIDRLTDGMHILLDIKYNSLFAALPTFHWIGLQPLLLTELDKNDFTFIHLVRNNKLAQIVSDNIAKTTDQWHFDEMVMDRDSVQNPTVSVDVGEIVRNIEFREAQAERVAHWLKGFKRLDLIYEEVFANGKLSRKAHDSICAFLQTDFPSSPLRFFKPERNFQKIISNFDDLNAALQGSRHAWMLDNLVQHEK